MLGAMTLLIPSRPAHRSTHAPSRPSLFIVIFDRRRSDRRRQVLAPLVERRKDDRRSADRDETMRVTGWMQVDPE